MDDEKAADGAAGEETGGAASMERRPQHRGKDWTGPCVLVAARQAARTKMSARAMPSCVTRSASSACTRWSRRMPQGA